MGRYAFFNTGFEYKFGFGVQSSHDILEFAGTGNYGLIQNEEPRHEWILDDKRYIQRMMDALEDHLGINGPFDFSIFESSPQGTSKLYSSLFDLMEKEKWDTNVFFHKYRLACILYHQLLYTNILEAHYEL